MSRGTERHRTLPTLLRLAAALVATSLLALTLVVGPASAGESVYRDWFNKGLDTTRWHVDQTGLNRVGNVTVEDSKLRVIARRAPAGWTTGSAALAIDGSATEVTVRLRMDTGLGIRGVVGLHAPGEVITEGNAGVFLADLRANGSRTASYPGVLGEGAAVLDRFSSTADFTEVREVRVTRSPGEVTYSVDGGAPRTMAADTLGGPMELVVAVELGRWKAQPASTTPDSVALELESIAVTSTSGASSPGGSTGSPEGSTGGGTTGGGTTSDLVFSDDFNGTELDASKWGKYYGTKGGSIRRAANVMVRDGALVLRTERDAAGQWTSAGVSSARALTQQYGEYEVRLRIDKGVGIKGVALLWPSAGPWPPEVDFFEISNHDRTKNVITVHHGTAENRKMIHRDYGADFTQWQVVGVRWSPGKLEFTLNGSVMTVVESGVPEEPMWLGLQSNVGKFVTPDNRTPDVVDFEIDWVRAYAYG